MDKILKEGSLFAVTEKPMERCITSENVVNKTPSIQPK